MENITIQKEELKAAVKESVREVFDQEFARLRASFLPFVSREEQADIETVSYTHLTLPTNREV